MTDPNLYDGAPRAFATPDELARVAVRLDTELAELAEQTTARLEARALRAERAILSLQERLDAAEALARDRIAEAERLHRTLERRVRTLELSARV